MGISYSESLLYLQKYSKGGASSDEIHKQIENNAKSGARFKKSVRQIITLPKNKPLESHTYLTKRGILNEEIKYWHMGVVLEPPYVGWILIPVYFKRMLRTYFLRHTSLNRKRYASYDRSDILFGLDDCQDTNKPLVIVEGIFDMLFVRRIGVQCVAALSNRLLKKQIEHLKQYKDIVIIPDNDKNEAGLLLVKESYPLTYKSDVSVAVLPVDVKDSAECPKDILEESFNRRMSLFDFIGTERYTNWMFGGNKHGVG
jgi:hypothetical protein